MPLPTANRLVLGFAHWGSKFVDPSVMMKTFALAAKEGITKFDVAPHYGDGSRECVLGVAASALPPEQKSLVKISTKVGVVIDPNTRSTNNHGFTNVPGFAQIYGYSGAEIEESFGQSQLRLGIREMDTLYVHDLDAMTHKKRDEYERHFQTFIKDGQFALHRLKEAGKIKAIGIGSKDPEGCIRLINAGFRPDRIMIAGCYNLLDTSAAGTLFPLCTKYNIEVYNGAPFGGGLLTAEKGNIFFQYTTASAKTLNRVETLRGECMRYNTTIRRAALQFALSHPQVAQVVVGPRTPEELMATLKDASEPLPKDFWRTLRFFGLIPDFSIIDIEESSPARRF